MRKSAWLMAALAAALVLGVPAPSPVLARGVACGCCLTCYPNIMLLGCQNHNDCETCCEAWQQRLCMGNPQLDRTGGVYGLPNEGLQLVVTPHDNGNGPPDGREVLTFLVPGTVSLEPGVYESQEKLEEHLIDRFVGGLPSPHPPPAPPLSMSCTPGVAYSPRDLVVRRPLGPASQVVAVAGVGFSEGAIPYFDGIPSTPLYGGMMVDVPLAGVVFVGYTELPLGGTEDVVEVEVEYCDARSNTQDFRYGQSSATGRRLHERE